MTIGGGGFCAGARDEELERWIAGLLGAERPRVCLLPTASGDPEEQIARFRLSFRRLGCETSHLSLFRLGDHPVELREHLLAQDAIYVGGGSMLNLLALWRLHGLDRILEQAWWRGILLAGVSAGSMCWFQGGITKSRGAPRAARGLGLLPGSNCVHHGEADRREAFRRALREGTLPAGWGVDDGAALLWEGTEMVGAVSARPGAGARRCGLRDGRVVETELAARALLEAPAPGPPVDAALEELRQLRTTRRAYNARRPGA